MNKKIAIWFLVLGIIIVLVFVLMSKNKVKNENGIYINKQISPAVSEVSEKSNVPVKEFSMTSFTDMVGGEPKPQFSLKEITVNKGDRVRIKITEVSGMHNFKIDEYNVYTDTPLGKESVVEFTADKAGSFIYYCSKPGHRANGQWGTLKVLDNK